MLNGDGLEIMAADPQGREALALLREAAIEARVLCEASGFRKIAPFGEYVGDPSSVCFEKGIEHEPHRGNT
jgi:hypothetical protein